MMMMMVMMMMMMVVVVVVMVMVKTWKMIRLLVVEIPSMVIWLDLSTDDNGEALVKLNVKAYFCCCYSYYSHYSRYFRCRFRGHHLYHVVMAMAMAMDPLWLFFDLSGCH